DGKALDRIVSTLTALKNYRVADLTPIRGQVSDLTRLVRSGPERTIAVFVRNSATQYSGGCYHALMMAEAFATLGHKVYFITENVPIFFSDFRPLRNHQDIEICLTKECKTNLPEWVNVDLVFCIPGMDFFYNFYIGAIHFAKKYKAPLVLLNFETPKWFNSLSPKKRDEKLWSCWNIISEHCALILSSTKEGTKYARQYFKKCDSSTFFKDCCPSINSIVADSVPDFPKEKRILILTRFLNSEHKGGFNLPDILIPSMKGYTIVLVVGTSLVPHELMKELNERASDLGIPIEVKYRISDYEKFVELKRASLMLFPFFFEGFSYLPVEALYCNTPSISFDLPVLRETCQDNLIYISRGDWSKLKDAIQKELDRIETHTRQNHLKQSVAHIACFENYAKRLDVLVEEICSKPVHKNLLNKAVFLKVSIQVQFHTFLDKIAGFLQTHLSSTLYDILRRVYHFITNLRYLRIKHKLQLWK
ncbi:glycosyltransferase, partial [bacterium]|nr:glycosyltransferase [bacterium]